MDDNLGHIVYSKNVLEFVTVAGEYTNLIESINNLSRFEFVMKAQKILPLLYLKGSLLPEIKNEYNEIVEKFVAEETWNYYELLIKQKLGKFNEYLEVFDPDISFSEGPVTASISENLADIYQDIKDFISAYRIGTTEIMNDSLWECKDNFEHYWGQKLLNATRAIHMVIYGKDGITEDDDENFNNLDNRKDDNDINTDDWILTKMQQQHRKDHEEE